MDIWNMVSKILVAVIKIVKKNIIKWAAPKLTYCLSKANEVVNNLGNKGLDVTKGVIVKGVGAIPVIVKGVNNAMKWGITQLEKGVKDFDRLEKEIEESKALEYVEQQITSQVVELKTSLSVFKTRVSQKCKEIELLALPNSVEEMLVDKGAEIFINNAALYIKHKANKALTKIGQKPIFEEEPTVISATIGLASKLDYAHKKVKVKKQLEKVLEGTKTNSEIKFKGEEYYKDGKGGYRVVTKEEYEEMNAANDGRIQAYLKLRDFTDDGEFGPLLGTPLYT